MKNTFQQPLKRKWTVQMIREGKSIRLKWVNICKGFVIIVFFLPVEDIRHIVHNYMISSKYKLNALQTHQCILYPTYLRCKLVKTLI